MAGTVLFLGAGATKSINGPLTDEILPAMFSSHLPSAGANPGGAVAALVQFLQNEFHVQPSAGKEHFPSLPLLMSLLDTALDRRELFAGGWDVQQLKDLREAIELAIFDVLEQALLKFPTNNHYQLLQRLFPEPEIPAIITTNYDLVADTALMHFSLSRQPEGGIPNYHCGLANLSAIRAEQWYGSVLKLHGSLNWLYCRTCQRLELGATDSTSYLRKFQNLAPRGVFTADGTACAVCQSTLRPLLVAPSHLKNYRNPHLAQVWYEAQRLLRQADRAVFVGYSLPDDDVEVVYLLKRALAHITDPKRITVVEYCADDPLIPLHEHPVGRRYRTLFGEVSWHAAGLDHWLHQNSAWATA